MRPGGGSHRLWIESIRPHDGHSGEEAVSANEIWRENSSIDTPSRGKRPAGCACVYVLPDGESSIVVSPGANAALDAAVVVADVKDIKADDILPAQLDATIESVEAASEHARARGAATIQHPEMLSTFDFITPNETYAGVLMGDGGRTIASPDDAAHLATSIVALAPRAAILKLGDRG